MSPSMMFNLKRIIVAVFLGLFGIDLGITPPEVNHRVVSAAAADSGEPSISDGDSTNIQDDRTYLDIFGETAKEFLTKKIIPPTDLECRWDWIRGRCEPICECSFQPKRGDFHLGRSCRKHERPQDVCSDDDLSSFYHKFTDRALHIGKIVARDIQKESKKVVDEATNHFQDLYSTLQRGVCSDLRTRCHDKIPEDSYFQIAWQEHLLCQNVISDCTSQGEQ